MADDVVIGSGATIPADFTAAADDIGGKKYQRVKFCTGDDGTAVDVGPSNPMPISGTLIASGAFDPPNAATATLANVPGSASSVTLQVLNTGRKGLIIVNDSTSVLYVKYGSAASVTSYTYFLAGSVGGVPAVLELVEGTIYTGIVTGIWVSATGTARVTELT